MYNLFHFTIPTLSIFILFDFFLSLFMQNAGEVKGWDEGAVGSTEFLGTALQAQRSHIALGGSGLGRAQRAVDLGVGLCASPGGVLTHE